MLSLRQEKQGILSKLPNHFHVQKKIYNLLLPTLLLLCIILLPHVLSFSIFSTLSAVNFFRRVCLSVCKMINVLSDKKEWLFFFFVLYFREKHNFAKNPNPLLSFYLFFVGILSLKKLFMVGRWVMDIRWRNRYIDNVFVWMSWKWFLIW